MLPPVLVFARDQRLGERRRTAPLLRHDVSSGDNDDDNDNDNDGQQQAVVHAVVVDGMSRPFFYFFFFSLFFSASLFSFFFHVICLIHVQYITLMHPLNVTCEHP